MKKEGVVIIIGIILLVALYYFLNQKSTQSSTSTGLTGAINTFSNSVKNLGSSINVTSANISSVTGLLGGLLSTKSSQPDPIVTTTESTDISMGGSDDSGSVDVSLIG